MNITKKIKRITLGILGATVLSLGLYACSNDNETTTSNTSTEQKNIKAKKTKLLCVTTSCCSVGPIGIEIWSHTECTYIDVKDGSLTVKMKVNSYKPIDKLTIDEDLLLCTSDEEKGWYLPKGTYSLVNNELSASARSIDVKIICVTKTHKGHFLGHQYNFEMTICAIVPVISVSKSSAVVTVDLNLTDSQLEQLKRDGSYIDLNEDIDLKELGINHTIKTGKHYVNEDGKIYINNVYTN